MYGHQFLTMILRCGDLILSYDIALYQKDEASKIDLAKAALKELPSQLIMAIS